MMIMNRTASAKEIHLLYMQMPELNARHSLLDIEMRLQHRPHVMLIAENQGRPIGFCAGYALDNGVFRLWMGGVLPAMRRRGAARSLLFELEAWARSRGYHSIRVKLRSCFQGMLLFLRVNHYLPAKSETPEDDQKNQIWLEKFLS